MFGISIEGTAEGAVLRSKPWISWLIASQLFLLGFVLVTRFNSDAPTISLALLLGGSGALAAGIWLSMGSACLESRFVNADKTLTVLRQGIFWRRHTTIPYQDIACIGVHETGDKDMVSYAVEVRRRSGPQVRLDSGLLLRQTAAEVVDRVAASTGLQRQDRRT